MNSVMKCLFGSKLYGTATPQSDTDYKEVFIPTANEILLGKYQDVISQGTGDSHSKNTSDDVDNDKYSLRKFINLLCDGDTFAMDMLHATSNPDCIISMDNPDVWMFIYNNRSKFYTCNMKSYLGYLRKQSGKYGVKGSRLAALRKVVDVLKGVDDEVSLHYPKGDKTASVKVGEIADKFPVDEFLQFVEVDIPQKGGKQRFYEVLGRRFQMTISVAEMKKSVYKLWDEYGDRARVAEANQGIDWKALHHALRAGLQIKEIYETGDLRYPLKDSTYLLEVKKGEHTFADVQKHLEQIVDEVEEMANIKQKEGMTKVVDKTFWDNFLIKVHGDEVISGYKGEIK